MTDIKTPILDDEEAVRYAADSNVDSNVASDPAEQDTHADWSMVIPVGGIEYHVRFGPNDVERLKTIIKPKPIPKDVDPTDVLRDHRESVRNVCALLCNMSMVGAEHHDERKLEQTPEQHHAEEVHHYPLDGFQIPDHFLPLSYVIEALADYIATTIGRAQANRGMDWISPTKSEQLTDVFNATAIAFFQFYGLGRIDPPIPLEAQR